MYEIRSRGELVACCDKPRYVKINKKNGVYVEATADEAIAVSVNGELYNINGGNAIPDAPQAVVVRRDGGEIVFRSRKRIEENGAAIIEAEDALCEIDAAAADRLDAIEDALCEMDSAMTEGVKG